MTHRTTESATTGIPLRRERTMVLAVTGAGLLFLMAYAPTLYQQPKIALLGVALVLVAVELVDTRARHVNRKLVLVLGAYVLVGAAYTAYGYARGNPGALPSARVYVVWPALLSFLLLAVTSWSRAAVLLAATTAAGVATSVYAALYMLSSRTLLPAWFLDIPIQAKQIYVQVPGQTLPTASFTFLGSMMFTLTFMFAVLVTSRRQRTVPRWAAVIGVVLGLAVIIVAGRRAVLLVFLVFPALWLVFTKMSTGRFFGGSKVLPVVGRLLAVVIAAVALVSLFSLTPAATQGDPSASAAGQIAGGFLDGFDPMNSADAAARAKQTSALIDGWKHNPVVGLGFGAAAPNGFIRSDSMPWGYELSYLALLMHAGAIGVAIYLGGFAWILLALCRQARRLPQTRTIVVACCVGMSAFLIGNFSNPYLARFDSLWVIFLPIAVLNAMLATPDPSDSGTSASDLSDHLIDERQQTPN
jgi:hypothetical protein